MALDLKAEERELGRANYQAASDELTRRGFMKSVAAGAGVIPVAAAVYFGYESVHGKPVKAALIGCGDEGGVLLGEHNPDYIEFVAACDIRPYNKRRILDGEPTGLRKGFKKIYGDSCTKDIEKNHFYTDWTELLDKEKEIEAVVIALPLHLHADVAIKCMERGKHVLCEKLMASTITDCRKMITAAKQHNRILSIGHQRHYSLLYAQALELLKSDVIGDIRHIRALWHRNFSWNWEPKAGQELAMDKQQPRFQDGWTQPILKMDNDELTDEKLKKYDYKDIYELVRWRLYKRTGGGLMAELGSHQLDASSIFLGKVHPLSVQGVGARSFFGAPGSMPFRNNREIDDHIFVTFEFPGKNYDAVKNRDDVVVVTYSSISTNSLEEYGECVAGTRGSLIVEKEQDVFLYRERDPRRRSDGPPRSTTLKVESSDAGKPVLDSGGTWGGPSAAAAPSATAGGAAKPGVRISRGYTEEMEDFAYCVRQWPTSGGYATRKDDKGKDDYIHRLPRCHGEVAMADAVIALTANSAMALKKRIEFKEAHFSADPMAELPEGEKRN
jgi:predicted dehydrogenase